MTQTEITGCFVTGTDTEVGKTHISAALLAWLSTQGLRCAGLKPVAAGLQRAGDRLFNEDVQALQAAGSVQLQDEDVGPFQFEAACAPQVAAALAQRQIDRQALLQHAQALSRRVSVLVVEGVGGFCVPLGDDWDSADLAQDLQLPVVLVVGMRLGCINHALLTAEAIRQRDLRLAGWVANTIPGPTHPMPYYEHNLSSLRHEFQRRHQAPCLGVVPFLHSPTPQQIAPYFDSTALRALFNLSHS